MLPTRPDYSSKDRLFKREKNNYQKVEPYGEYDDQKKGHKRKGRRMTSLIRGKPKSLERADQQSERGRGAFRRRPVTIKKMGTGIEQLSTKHRRISK